MCAQLTELYGDLLYLICIPLSKKVIFRKNFKVSDWLLYFHQSCLTLNPLHWKEYYHFNTIFLGCIDTFFLITLTRKRQTCQRREALREQKRCIDCVSSKEDKKFPKMRSLSFMFCCLIYLRNKRGFKTFKYTNEWLTLDPSRWRNVLTKWRDWQNMTPHLL